jgi:hypothetical protein
VKFECCEPIWGEFGSTSPPTVPMCSEPLYAQDDFAVQSVNVPQSLSVYIDSIYAGAKASHLLHLCVPASSVTSGIQMVTTMLW